MAFVMQIMASVQIRVTGSVVELATVLAAGLHTRNLMMPTLLALMAQPVHKGFVKKVQTLAIEMLRPTTCLALKMPRIRKIKMPDSGITVHIPRTTVGPVPRTSRVPSTDLLLVTSKTMNSRQGMAFTREATTITYQPTMRIPVTIEASLVTVTTLALVSMIVMPTAQTWDAVEVMNTLDLAMENMLVEEINAMTIEAKQL